MICDVPVLSPLKSPTRTDCDNNDFQDDLDIASWFLPPPVERWFKSKGLSSIFEWQRDCLKSEGVLNGKNLIFSAPTSAGKTLVADILMLKQVFENRKKVLVILPFVSIAREKMLTLQSMLRDTHARVGGFMGTHHAKGGIDGVDIAISTIEKANNIILKLIQDKTLDKLGAIIVDELHLVGDHSRGHLLELLLTKVMFVSHKFKYKIQVVGMSATLPNLDDLGAWLSSSVFKTDFRPVPLVENIKIGRAIFETSTMKNIYNLTKAMYQSESDDVIYLTIKTILDGYGVIVFWNNKSGVEALAARLSTRVKDVLKGSGGAKDRMSRFIDAEKIENVLAQMKGCPIKEDQKLVEVIKSGVGFHHAGLCMEQREIVEDAFRDGALRVLVATSTLSSGVNLPARRVIIRTPCIYGNKMMDVMMYKQMIGRAGRKGIDEKGESYLLCADDKEGEIGKKLVSATYPPVKSCLYGNSTDEPSPALKRAVLEAIVTGLVTSIEEANLYLNATLLSHDTDEDAESFKVQLDKTLDYLSKFKFVTFTDGKLEPTQLGKGCVAASLSPDDGLKLLNELLKARKGFVLNCDLHLLYQIIPSSIIRSHKFKTDVMREVFDHLQDKPEFEYCKDVWQALKISPTTLYSHHMEYVEHPFQDADSFKRLFVALALNDIIQEHPIEDLEVKYDINRGLLQSLQNTVSTFAGMIAIFCNKLGWHNLEVLVDQFQSRLEFGVQRELIDIMRIPTMNALLARQLYDASYDAVTTIAHSTPEDILKVFNSAKTFEASSPRRRLQNLVWIESQRKSMSLDDISQAMVREARELVEKDVGRSINWEVGDDSLSSASELSPNVSGDKPLSFSFKTPRTPKTAGQKRRKSPRKIMSRKELNKIDREVRKSLQSASLGEHSISIDPSMADSPPEGLLEEVAEEQKEPSSQSSASCSGEGSSSQLSTTSSTPVKSSSDDGGNEEVLCPKVLFTPDRKLRNKRLASPSTSFEALKRSKILKLPGSQSDEASSNQKLGTDPFVKISIRPDTKFTKILADDRVEYEKIVEKWKSSKAMSLEVDVTECFVIEKKIGRRHGARNSPQRADDGIIFDGGKQKLVRFLLCFGTGGVHFVTGHQCLKEFSEVIRDFLALNAENQMVICFDILKIYRVFRECFDVPKDVLFKIKWFDVRVGHWLNEPEGDPRRRRNVHDLVQTYLPDYRPLSMKKKASLFYSTAFLFPLAIHINDLLFQMGMKTIFESIETKASLVLAELECTGIGLEAVILEQTKTLYCEVMEKLEKEAFKLAGKNFNLNSPKQVSSILYNDLKLLSHCYEVIDKNPIRVEKLKKANKLPEHLKTSKEMLEKLRPFHPLPGLIAEYRKLSYTVDLMSSLLKFCRKEGGNGHRVSGRIDTFHATGRISMDNPNLMGATKTFEVTSLPQKVTIDVRKHFVPRPGYLFLSADYSQLELRLLAHFSQDPTLLSALNSGGDIFRAVAASIHDKDFNEVTDEERSQAKQICYGIVYGVGSKKLSENLGVSEEEAKEFRDVFLVTYPEIETFLEKVVEDCEKEEVPHIKTLVGRLRLLPLMKGNADDQAKAGRQAVNSTIQGSASDLIKLSMIKIEDVIQSKGLDARLVLEMHDELIFEVNENLLMEFAQIVSNAMEKTEHNNYPIDLKVKLTANLKQGINWSQMNELKLQPKNG